MSKYILPKNYAKKLIRLSNITANLACGRTTCFLLWELREPKSHEILMYDYLKGDAKQRCIFYLLFWESTMIMCKTELYNGIAFLEVIMKTNKHKQFHEP